MNANNVYIFLNKPLISILIYFVILVVLAYSFYEYRKGRKEYKYVSIGFFLIFLGRTIQKLLFLYGIRPKTFLGTISSIVVISLALASIIFIFYLPHRFSKK